MKNLVFVGPVVDRQLASLAEGLEAARVLAFVRLMPGVHVQVVLQVLGQGKLLVTELALEPPSGVVDRLVPFQAILVCVLFGAVWESAGILFIVFDLFTGLVVIGIVLD